jgi:long-chain fatty acid transport protein
VKVRNITLSLLFVLFSSLVYAGGFQINEHGARAMAMGGAITAIGTDASAIYYNNAAIINLTGLNVMVGSTMIAPSSTFTGKASGVENTMSKQKFYPSHAYVTYAVHDNLVVGIGFNNPFGLGTQWDDNWEGRYNWVKADVKVYSILPTVAYRVSSNLSVGVSVQYNLGKVTLAKKAPVVLTPPTVPALVNFGDSYITLDAKDNQTFGVNLGILWNVNDALDLGLSYRSAVTYRFSGTATSTLPATVPAPYQSAIAAQLPHGEISGDLVTPKQLQIGVGYKVCPKLQLSGDFQYIGWASYDRLVFTFKSMGTSSTTVRDYKNTFIGRIGGEYKASDALALRAGLLYDKNPVKDELVDASLPDADRIGITAGFGYKLTKNIAVDLGYMYLDFANRTVTTSTIVENPLTGAKMNGTYKSSASLVSLSVSYSL